MKRFTYLYLSAMVGLLIGCRGDLLDKNPYGSISSGNMWISENLADQGVMGVYSTLYSSYVGLGLFVLDCHGVSADQRDYAEPVISGKATTGSDIFLTYWKQHYEGIHRANDAIKNLEKAQITDTKRARLIAEAKFLRAYFYYKLNMVYQGVPLYLEPVEIAETNRPRETADKIWETIIADLSDCIAETNLPDRYAAGNANYGRITKTGAYALRGKTYLWKKEWANAEADFKKVGDLGHSLFQGEYKQLFKEANEQCDEMIFSVQCTGLLNYGNEMTFRYGSRVVYGQGWNTYLANTDFVDSYENIDGSPFDWNATITDYTDKTPTYRARYFYRNMAGLNNEKPTEKTALSTLTALGTDGYDPVNNEARIQKAYENRDPRLKATIITPYSEFHGSSSGLDYTYILRWPYAGYDASAPYDVRTDTNNRFFYLFRKFVAEGSSETPNRQYSPLDFPLIRYADILLNLAEALNEQGKTDEAVAAVNKVRQRAGAALLNSNTHTQVSGQDNLRTRIRNERRWELAGEGINYFDELRWRTLKESKFFQGAGLKEIWGTSQYENSWGGDHYYVWPIPRKERQMNDALEQNPGWTD